MRTLGFIQKHPPCSTDYCEEGNGEGEFVCPNFINCKTKKEDGEEIYCYRKLGYQIAMNALKNSEQLGKILSFEKRKFFKSINIQNDSNFWICYEGEWSIAKGKENVVNYVIKFAKIILNGLNAEWVNRGKDGLITEIGPTNPFHLQNVLLERGGQEKIPL